MKILKKMSFKENNPLTLPHNVGILGGGQLSRMLCLSGHHLGLTMHVLSESQTDPAAQVVRNWKKGSITDLRNFVKPLQTLTFESEFFNADSVAELIKSNPDLQVFPNLNCLKTFQDRKLQKEKLIEFKIPTQKFFVPSTWAQLKESLRHQPLVLKKRRGGYDGKGTFILKNAKDFDHFYEKFYDTDLSQFIAEFFSEFIRELAVIFVRSKSGDFKFFPLVESKQVQSRCDWVVGPIKHPQLAALAHQFQNLMNKMNYTGVLAAELFETRCFKSKSSELIVNELAPRVHNSGHYTQNAFNYSQFELHLRAGIGLPLPELVSEFKSFGMVNLIGNLSSDRFIFHEEKVNKLSNIYLHWYGKTDSCPGRKMGHLNFTGKSQQLSLKEALIARRKIYEEKE